MFEKSLLHTIKLNIKNMQVLTLRYVMIWWISGAAAAAATTPILPQLNGQHFRITAVVEVGFLDIREDVSGADNNNTTNNNNVTLTTPKLEFSGYLVDMLAAVSIPERANFTYELLPPSGYGTSCDPRLTSSAATLNVHIRPYNARYRTQYNCGANDANDDTVPGMATTDMYLGLFYVTPTRQLINQFTIPFLPPVSGTLTMFGTATNIANLTDLTRQQWAETQREACFPAGTAIGPFLKSAFPGIQIKGIVGGENEIFEAFRSGECEVYIVDYPVATQIVLRYHSQGRCVANGKVRTCVCVNLRVMILIIIMNESFFCV
jgi:ABC-type amino acid transport substrate-binding protein